MTWQLTETFDVAAVLDMHRRVFSEALPRNEFAERTAGFETHLYFAGRPGEPPAGFCVFRRRNGEAELWQAGVLPERRRQGAGAFILDHGQREMAALGCSRLTVSTYNRWHIMLSMLFKRGFRLIATEHSGRRDDFQLQLYTELRQRREMRYALTEKCNFSCLFCHNEGLGHESRTTLPDLQVLETLLEAVRLGYTDITFTGGEPLREKARLLYLLEGLGRSSLSPDITLVTNGSLLDRQVVEALAVYPGPRKIHLSLHASDADTFGKVTGTRRPELFDRVKTNIRMAAQSGLLVKMNHVVLRDLNHTRVLEAVELARALGAATIKFLELLVLPDNPDDYRMFYDIDSIQKQVEQIADGPEKKGLRQRIFRHRSDTRFTIELQRLTCSIGCGHCRETRDRTFSSDMNYHPCFIRHKKHYPVKTPNRLEQILQNGDRLIDGFAARYKDSSPTLVQKELYIATKTEFFFGLDSTAAFREFLKAQGFSQVAAVGFHEEYFRPRGRPTEWERFERVLKVGWDYHDQEQTEMIYTDHRYTLYPELGLEVATRFLDVSGPVRFESADHARHFLDRLDFERFLVLEWELETWKRDRFQVNLGAANSRATAKVNGTAEAAAQLMQIARSYAGRFEPLCEPLAAYMSG